MIRPTIVIDKTPAQMAYALTQRHPGKYDFNELLTWPSEVLAKTYLRFASSIREVRPYLRQFAQMNRLNLRNAHTAITFYKSLE